MIEWQTRGPYTFGHTPQLFCNTNASSFECAYCFISIFCCFAAVFSWVEYEHNCARVRQTRWVRRWHRCGRQPLTPTCHVVLTEHDSLSLCWARWHLHTTLPGCVVESPSGPYKDLNLGQALLQQPPPLFFLVTSSPGPARAWQKGTQNMCIARLTPKRAAGFQSGGHKAWKGRERKGNAAQFSWRLLPRSYLRGHRHSRWPSYSNTVHQASPALLSSPVPFSHARSILFFSPIHTFGYVLCGFPLIGPLSSLTLTATHLIFPHYLLLAPLVGLISLLANSWDWSFFTRVGGFTKRAPSPPSDTSLSCTAPYVAPTALPVRLWSPIT